MISYEQASRKCYLELIYKNQPNTWFMPKHPAF